MNELSKMVCSGYFFRNPPEDKSQKKNAACAVAWERAAKNMV